jgi:hypothetical protein
MRTVPTGRPAWSRTTDHTDYGGDLGKKNYQNQGVVNPKTDVGAEAITRLAADLMASVRTAPFLVCSIACQDTQHIVSGGTEAGPDAPLFGDVLMQTGVRTASYVGSAPPTGFPSAARNGTGDFTITFASSYSDPYGVSEPFTPQSVIVCCQGTTFANATATISGSTVRVRVFDAAGAALPDRRVSVVVS